MQEHGVTLTAMADEMEAEEKKGRRDDGQRCEGDVEAAGKGDKATVWRQLEGGVEVDANEGGWTRALGGG